jgi:hypothetical protein
MKIPVTPSGIDPGTVRLVAQRLNHYVTPGHTAYTVAFVIHFAVRVVNDMEVIIAQQARIKH